MANFRRKKPCGDALLSLPKGNHDSGIEKTEWPGDLQKNPRERGAMQDKTLHAKTGILGEGVRSAFPRRDFRWHFITASPERGKRPVLRGRDNDIRADEIKPRTKRQWLPKVNGPVTSDACVAKSVRNPVGPGGD